MIYLIHTKKPNSLTHILNDEGTNSECQIFNNKYVRKASYYRSDTAKNSKVCKNCLNLVEQDDFADGPEN